MVGGKNFSIPALGAFMSSLQSADIGDDTRAGVEKAAAHLTTEIQDRAPVDTGHLRDSYGYVVDGSGTKVTAHVGTNVDYAVHQEYGTVYQSGTPHVRPALEANRGDLVRMMGEDAILNFVNRVST